MMTAMHRNANPGFPSCLRQCDVTVNGAGKLSGAFERAVIRSGTWIVAAGKLAVTETRPSAMLARTKFGEI